MRTPSEDSEQAALVAALRRAGLCFVHVPMGGARSRGSGASMKRLGASKGFPDLLVFDKPGGRTVRCTTCDCWDSFCGVAIELKRADGGKGASKEQREWLTKLAERGWLTAVCNGAGEALEQLRVWGYVV